VGISTGRAKTVFLLGIVAVVIAFLFWLQKVVLLAFLALLIAIVLDAIARPGARFLKMPRGLAIIVGAILFLGIVVGTLSLLIMPLAQEGAAFQKTLPQRTANLNKKVTEYRENFPWMKRILPDPNQEPSSASANEVAKKAVGTASAIFGGLVDGLAVFFLAIYFAWDPDRWLRGVAELWPRGSPETRIDLMRKLGSALRSYLFAIGIYIVAMGTLWTLGLWLIGIPYPLLFGTIGGVVEIVQYIGPMIGLIPPLLVAMTMGTTKVIYVLLLYALLHIVEGYILVPYLMHRKEHLPPPIVVLSILAFGTVFGLLGVLLAIPLGTVGYVLANELIYKKRKKTSHGYAERKVEPAN
jgi:predicted PurR-regulated permease PerM